jgi:hypothetical protein
VGNRHVRPCFGKTFSMLHPWCKNVGR